MRTRSLSTIAAIFMAMTITVAQKDAQKDLATSPWFLRVDGRVMDNTDGALSQAQVRVEKDGVELSAWSADGKGRFSMDLDIGGLYAIDVDAEGYVRKRFIVDARAEDPAKVETVPFEAYVTLITAAAVAGADLDQLDFPFAMVTYSKKEKAFMADPVYIEEMKRLESALMLSAVLSQRRKH